MMAPSLTRPFCLYPPRWLAGTKEYDLPVIAQIPVLFATLGFLETKRLQGWKETGTVSVGARCGTVTVTGCCQGGYEPRSEFEGGVRPENLTAPLVGVK